MKHFPIRHLTIVLITIVFATGCSKKASVNPTPTPTTAITSLSVSTGPYNTSVIITGTGFDATSANDKVFFNGKAAAITAATATQLTATVPLGAGTGNVTVSVNNSAPVSGPVFTYQPTWIVSTIAGSGAAGNADGNGTSASFNNPWSLTVDKNGVIYVVDRKNAEIRKITADNNVSTIATPADLMMGGIYQSTFYWPYGIAVDDAGYIYVSEDSDCVIRRIDPSGADIVFAGDETHAGYGTDGTGSVASFFDPAGLTVDKSGNIFLAEYIGYTIRKITPGATVSTIAGKLLMNGSNDGTGAAARFFNPTGLTIDPSGNLYIADRGNHLIRKIASGNIVTTIAGDGTAGYNNGNGKAASFNDLENLVMDKAGNLYVTDTNVIRKIDPSGNVTIFAGQLSAHGSTDGPVSSATFFNCRGIAIDANGTLYIGDTGNNLIRKITLE